MKKQMILILSLITISVSAVNLVKNSGFEDIEKGRPVNWFLSSGKGSGSLEVIDGEKSRVLSISAFKDAESSPAAMTGSWEVKDMIQVTPGNPIKVSVMAKSNNGGDAFIKVIFRTNEGKWVTARASRHFELKDEWKKCKFKGIVPKKAAYVQMQLCVRKGDVLFDDAVLKCIEPKNVKRSAEKAEYWINLDYNDNVSLCGNLGLKNYTEKEIGVFFGQCKTFGVDGVLWRVSATGQFMYHTKVGTVYPGRAELGSLSDMQKRRALNMKNFDPLEVAIREARKNGVKIMIWMTISDEYSTKKDSLLQGTNELVLKNPEYALVDKSGKPFKGTLCYNVPEVRKYRLDIIKELLTYKADGIYMCTRTHAFYHGKDKGMDYGYNVEIVDEYKKRYGKNILVEEFDKQKWLDIRAEGLTQLVADAEKLVHGENQQLWLGIKTTANEKRGWPYGDALFPWKKWVKNGWVDTVVVGQYFIPYSRIVVDSQTFREVAGPDQKILFWQQLWHYQKQYILPLEELMKQVSLISFAGGNGAVYHEGFNLEERVEDYWKPLSETISKQWK